MQLPKTSGLVVWLLPAPDQSRLFRKVISNLSEQYNGISFVPHVTLSSVPDFPPEKIIKLTDWFSNQLSQLQVDVGEVECRPHPYRKVVVPIDDATMIGAFKNSVNEAFNGTFCKESDFHLSLLYGHQKCNGIDLEAIERELMPVNKLYMQRIAVVDLNFTPDKWKIIFEQSL